MGVVRAISAVLVLAGLVLLAFAVNAYRSQASFIADTASAEGEIVAVTTRHRTSWRYGTSSYHTYRVRFRTSGGDTIENQAMEDSNAPLFTQGEKVTVLYSRARPAEFNIDDFTMMWADAVVLFVVAGTLLGMGATAFWIAGGRPRLKVRNEASLPEIARAWREGRLTRDSEFQGMLLAFTFAGFAVLGGAIIFVLFAPGLVQLIFGVTIAYAIIQAVRARRAAKESAPKSKPRR